MDLLDSEVQYYADFIENNLGIVYKPDNFYQLQRRLGQVAVQLEFDDVSAMHQQLKNGIYGHAKVLILDIATNNETLFFRDKKVFDGFSSYIRENEEFASGRRQLRVWSAACSTGQEPYSLSIILNEWKTENPARSYRIFATDYSDRVLKYAENGQYTQLEVQRGLKTKQLLQYFDLKEGVSSSDTWVVKPFLKNNIVFEQLNLLAAWPHLDTFDFIFCRNVLIYFDVELKSKIIAKMFTKLNDGGHLLLGSAESLVGLSQDFVSAKLGDANFYQKKFTSRVAS